MLKAISQNGTVMMPFFLSCLMIFSLLYSEEGDNIYSLEIELPSESEPLATVLGCVNVISGSFFQMETDLASNTIEPIRVVRSYDSQSKVEPFLGLGFSLQFPLFASSYQKNARHSYALISEREGGYITFKGNYSGQGPYDMRSFVVDDRVLKKGYTNASHTVLGGSENLINRSAQLNGLKDTWEVTLENGSRRIYNRKHHLDSFAKKRLRFPTHDIYLLTKEIKPNGNILEYDYYFEKNLPSLASVKTYNRDHSHILNEIHFSKSHGNWVVRSSCHSQTIYKNKVYHGEKRNRDLLEYVSTSQHGHTEYGFLRPKGSDTPLIGSINKLNGFQQIVEYDSHKRVHALNHSTGHNNELVRTHQFNYGDHYTSVSNCLNHRTDYYYDKNKRIIQISYLEKTNLPSKPLRSDYFEWMNKEGKESLLKSKKITNQNGIIHKKSYEYDERGNVVKETLRGNISGTKADTFSNENETDSYSIFYEYSQDGLNLLLKMIKPEGLTLIYEYLPGTNLKSAEYEYYNGKIQKRTFYQYDLNGQISQIDEDDGSLKDPDNYTDANYHLKTVITPCLLETAAYGKPQKIDKFYVTIAERVCNLLTTTLFEYDERGNCLSSSTYDSNGSCLTSISNLYDSCNRVCEETDPNGYKTRFEYDFNNNLILEENLTTRKLSRYFYNSVNKLLREEAIYSDNDKRITEYSYDPLGNLVKKVDEFGNLVTYKYDLFNNEIERSLTDSTFKCSYNVIGQKTSETDPTGNKTRYKRNILGKPTEIEYPDGSTQTFLYNMNGTLKEEKLLNDSYILYEYDPKGHLIKKEFHDSQDCLLKSETYVYRGDKLISVKDHTGSFTNYYHDQSGRVIAEDRDGKIIDYKRDGLGRVIESKENERTTRFKYDGKGNIISKSFEGFTTDIYEYDSNNNQIKHIFEVNPGQFITKSWGYNPDNTLSYEIDEEGHATCFQYERNKSLIVIRIDPKFKIIRDSYDAQNRLIQTEVSKNGELLSRIAYRYDLNSNVREVLEEVFHNHNLERTFVIQKSYDSMNRMIKLIEGEKTTYFQYNSSGKLIKKVMPDNVAIMMSYDPLLRLAKKTSSDGSIDYEYQYDVHDNLISTRDFINGTDLKRSFDIYNRLTSETIRDYKIQFEYDSYDRLTKIILPDNTSIQYLYDTYQLKKIRRVKNELSYDISITLQDLVGRPLEIVNPGFTSRYAYSDCGNILSIQNNQQTLLYGPYDPNGNLLQAKEIYDQNETITQFSYDPLDQLIEEEGPYTHNYTFDSIGNCRFYDDSLETVNAANQLTETDHNRYNYDKNGRLNSDIHNHYSYDALGRLTSLSDRVRINYDSENRPITINDKNLIYLNNKEIGALKDSALTELKIVHPDSQIEKTFAIEINGEPYFVEQDRNHNISLLISKTGLLIDKYEYSSFKEETILDNPLSPWRYSNRRQIENLTLFKHRLYSPEMKRWLTPDPLDYLDGNNLYRYVKNNPQRYHDPDGRFAFVIPLAIVSFEMGAAVTSVALPTIYTALAATAATATYFGIKAIDAKYGTHLSNSMNGNSLFMMNTANTMNTIETSPAVEEGEQQAQESPQATADNIPKEPKYKFFENENGQTNLEGIYVPERPFPRDPRSGDYAPESNDPHTVLGIENGTNGKYIKGIEFGKNGEKIKQIHFTDHGSPWVKGHTAPHEHPYKDNITGGSKNYTSGQRLSTWDYINNCPLKY